MRLIDADKLIEQMKLQAGCAECDSYHGILCKSCQWNDAIDLADDFADNHPYKYQESQIMELLKSNEYLKNKADNMMINLQAVLSEANVEEQGE